MLGGSSVALCALVVGGLLAGCGSDTRVDSGGLTAGDRNDAQTALSALHGSNVALQLVSITNLVQATPATCRLHLASSDPTRFHVYVFWIPWLGSQSYTWLNMSVTKDPSRDVFNLGTAKPVLPGGSLTPNGRSVDPFTQDTTLLSRYGPAQAKRNQEVLMAHAGDVFTNPGAKCELLANGDLRLVPNP
jgi:hypothetical protein